ncbi:MAG: U32 family peptidase [Oscillospiraceae bacterium]|nr:U32 family peptidase [Oscillospiraceae bacterium]
MVKQKLELLSPAGDAECLEAAVDFGCNAVYLGGKSYGMRAGSKNFAFDEMKRAAEYAHAANVKVYLTCNTTPSNGEIEAFPEFIKNAQSAGIDAAIVCDLGIMSLIKQHAPSLDIHISTQVGVTNYAAANELYKLGAKRIVLARETGIDEIKRIREKIPEDMEIEAFVHGAMCVSFSGRCLLSAYMTGRNANKGECAQPCRWKYSLVEETRPDQYFPISEDDNGTYILNAKDMCMIEHLDKLIDAGVTSFKIEGRAKSAYYVATVTNAYRIALDCAKRREPLPDWVNDEVYNVSHRSYCTGFYFDSSDAKQVYESSGYDRSCDFVGVIDGYEDGFVLLTQRNYFTLDDDLEVLTPGGRPVKFHSDHLYNSDGEEIKVANHATEKLRAACDIEFPRKSILRRINKQ